jgi:hypothetical protein
MFVDIRRVLEIRWDLYTIKTDTGSEAVTLCESADWRIGSDGRAL